MSNLGSLYFALGLDDKQFNNAIEAAKKKVQELGANINVSVNVDTAKAVQQLQSVLHADNSVKINADISQLTANIKQAEKELQELKEKSSWNTSAINSKQGFIENQQAQLTKLQQQLKLIESLSPTVNLKVSVPTSEYTRVVNEVKTALSNKAGIDVAITPKINKTNIKSALKTALDNVEMKINAKPVVTKKDLKKLELEANKTTLRNSISNALKNQTFKAKVELVVEKAKVQDAIRAAFQQAGMNYDTSASDVRAARIREIEERARSRGLLDQERLNRLRSQGYRDAVDGSSQLNRSMSLTDRLASQLGERIVAMFSINALQQFVQNLYIIGGEFQKQQIALQNMIGDAEKANVVFDRIKDLSVKSPFSFAELARYTKQMSAYGIEYKELYDTTKRLADISAGVGVDMSRLILAYGQVRSAEVLRGQELRQFTEAGIPLVAELAKRLEEVRGEAVAVGEVFDAISRREVSFDMVKDVLFDMTDPGGRFFESQERLAESLAGKWSNLKDAWDIMMAGIADSQNGALGLLADTLTAITREWRLWIPLMGGVATGLAAIAIALGVVEVKAMLLRIELMKNPYLLAAGAIIALGTAVYGYVSSAEDATETTERLNEELEKQIQILSENKENAGRYLDILEKQEKSESEKLKLQKKQQVAFNALVKMYPDLLQGYTLEQMSAEKILEIRKKINEETNKQTLESHDNKINNLQKSYQKANEKYLTTKSRYDYAQNYGTGLDKWLMPSKEDVDKAQAEAAQLYIAWQEALAAKKAYDEEHANDDLKIKLTKDSSLEDYVKVYRELGKTVKILRDADITGTISDPKLGKDIIKYVEELKEALSEEEKIMDNFDSGSRVYQAAEKRANAYKLAISSLDGVVDSERNKDYVAELWKNRAEEIDKAIKTYDKWKEVEGKDKASQRIKGMSEFADLFNGKYGFNLDLENPTATYEYIQSKLNKALEKQRELYIQLGVKLNESKLDDAKDALKIFLDESKKYIDETTSKWNLYKDLFQKTGNKSLAMNIAFGKEIGFTNQLEQLRSQIEQGLKGTKFNFSDVIGFTDKELEENGLSSLKHFIEAYNKESQKISEETIENFLDIIKASKDFAQQISDIETKLVRDLNAIYGSSLPAEEKSRLEKQLYENYEENIAKINFEKFKKSSGWVSIFDDLSKVSTGALDSLLEDIEKFIPDGVKSEKVFKELIKSIREVKEELLSRNPFRAFSNDTIISLGKINHAISEYNKKIKEAKQNGDTSKVKELEAKKYEEQSKRREIYSDYSSAFKAGMDKVTEFSNSVSEASSMLERFGNESLKNFASFLDSISKGMQSGYNVGGMFGGVGSVIGGFVGAATGVMAGIVDAGRNAVQAEQERSQIVIDRLEKVASILKDKIAGSLTGLYNSALSYTAKVEMELQKQRYDAALKYYKDKGETVKENEIKATTFDNTSFSWDLDNYIIYSKKTHDAINKAIESDNEYMAAYASMLAQRDELIYQQATYSDKDSDDVEAFKRDKALEIEKLTIEIEQLSKDMLSSLYSIDFKDWAGQFADAIVGAWSKGEDAAKAYQDVVSDVMKNVATSMIQQLVVGRYLEEQLPAFVEKFIANNGLFDDELLAELGGVVEGLTGRIEIAENLLDGWEDKLNEKGISLKETEGKEGSLSKGIQSVTEDTANLLASYLNSVRQDVSVKRSLIEKFIGEDMPKMSVIAQAQLTQLNIIASNTLRNADTADRIYELVNRVVDRGSNKLKI